MGFRGSRVQIPPSRLLTNSRTDCRTDSGRRKPYSRGPESWAPRHIYLKALLRRRVLLRRAGDVVGFTALLELAPAPCPVSPRPRPPPGLARPGPGARCERATARAHPPALASVPLSGRRRSAVARCVRRRGDGRVRAVRPDVVRAA